MQAVHELADEDGAAASTATSATAAAGAGCRGIASTPATTAMHSADPLVGPNDTAQGRSLALVSAPDVASTAPTDSGAPVATAPTAAVSASASAGGAEALGSGGVSEGRHHTFAPTQGLVQGVIDPTWTAPEHTMVLPASLQAAPPRFRSHVLSELLDEELLTALENMGALNLFPCTLTRLVPLRTKGDGNCLLHAASLALWGVHDHHLQLRSALVACLQAPLTRKSFYDRWRAEGTREQALDGITEVTEEQWEEEWRDLNERASTAGDWLDGFHVFVLAHVLRRPIFIAASATAADLSGNALAPVRVGGVYLPLLLDVADCHTVPLTLAYHESHFAALVLDQSSPSSSSLGSSLSSGLSPSPDGSGAVPSPHGSECRSARFHVHSSGLRIRIFEETTFSIWRLKNI